MKKTQLFLSFALLGALAGCAATGGDKKPSPVYAPVRTATEYTNDTQDLADATSALANADLSFDVKQDRVGTKTVAWKAPATEHTSSTKPATDGEKITLLDRFVEMAKSYLVKYQLYTMDGKVTKLPAEARQELQDKIDLCEAKLKELRGEK